MLMVARTSMGKLWSLKDKTNLAFPSNFKGDLAIRRAACDVILFDFGALDKIF